MLLPSYMTRKESFINPNNLKTDIKEIKIYEEIFQLATKVAVNVGYSREKNIIPLTQKPISISRKFLFAMASKMLSLGRMASENELPAVRVLRQKSKIFMSL